MVKDLEWGISPDSEVDIAWGARAIYNSFNIDLLWDRMCMEGGTPEQRKQFSDWLNAKGLPALKKLVKQENVRGSDERVLTISLDGWLIAASPKGSCGYLYIGVWPNV